MLESTMKCRLSIPFIAALGLAACSDSDIESGTGGSAESDAATIEAPAGQYRLDPNHSSLSFSVNHLGLSNYIARFASHDARLDLDPDNLSDSSVTVTIDPSSIRTDYAGDYQATHPDSGFRSWDEDLALSEKFFNADEFPDIEFRSTEVNETGPGSLRIVGDLSMLGQTHPVTLDARVVGSVAAHPMSGAGALGFSATGEFKRSTFGMTHLLNPPLIGDTVTLRFEGEFQQIEEEAATAGE